MAEIRLGKAASEFNVSTQTIIESLQKKGFAIENKPTAKLTEEMYSYISSVFSSDKEAKEQSKSIGLKLKKREDAVKTEEVTPKAKTEEKPVANEPEVKNKAKIEVSNTAEQSEETPKAKGKSKSSESDKTGLVVKGKIDLPGNKKKKEEIVETPKAVEPTLEPVNTLPETIDPLIDDDRELVKANLVELDGLTITADNWWFNLRPSNTEPLLRLNVEADTEKEMVKIRDTVLSLI